MCSKPIFCSKIALKGKTCSRLLKPQKVAPNAKSCSKVAEHNRDRPIPHPLCGCPFYFSGGWGGGDMGDLVWARIFFPKALELDIFSLTYNGVRFFFSIIYVIREIFFSAGYYFSQVYPCNFFPLEISLQHIFF